MEGRSLVVLTDLCVNGRQLRAMSKRLELSGAWACYGTAGVLNPETRARTGGVLVAWDTRCYVQETREVVVQGRVVAVRLQDCRAQQSFTVFGAYMPVRSRAARVVEPVWGKLADAFTKALRHFANRAPIA